jgi:hypothetical protein
MMDGVWAAAGVTGVELQQQWLSLSSAQRARSLRASSALFALHVLGLVRVRCLSCAYLTYSPLALSPSSSPRLGESEEVSLMPPLPLIRPPVEPAPSEPDDGDTAMPPPSAPSSQPARKVGRGDASRGDPVDAVTGSGAVASSKRARVDPPVPSSAPLVVMDEDEKQTVVTVPAATYASAVRAGVSPSTPVMSASPSSSVVAVAVADSAAAAARAAHAVPPSRAVADYNPLPIARDKLLEKGLDNRRLDAVYMNVDIDARWSDPPRVDSLYFSCNADAKRRFTATFLGSMKGLAITPPLLPRLLVAPDAATVATPLTVDQRAWLEGLQRLMMRHGSCLSAKSTAPAARVAAVDDLTQHLNALHPDPADPRHRVLWPRDQLTESWEQLLAPRSCILRYRSPAQHQVADGRISSCHRYELVLHGATPEAAYVIASMMSAYAESRAVCPPVTAAITKVLPATTTSLTSSDDDEEYTPADSRRRRSAAARKELAAIAKRLASLEGSDLLAKHKQQYITGRPLLALVCTVSVRPVQIPYMSVIIDNWQSIGCNVEDLANCPVYHRVTALRPEFCPGNATRWSVQQSISTAVACVWLRQEYKELLTQLNTMICADLLLKLESSSLRIRCTVAQKSKRGRIIPSSVTKVTLSEKTVVAPPAALRRPPRAATPAATAAPQPPAPGSYAARVAESVALRKAQQSAQSLNHKPRKVQRVDSPVPTKVRQQHQSSSTSPSEPDDDDVESDEDRDDCAGSGDDDDCVESDAPQLPQAVSSNTPASATSARRRRRKRRSKKAQANANSTLSPAIMAAVKACVDTQLGTKLQAVAVVEHKLDLLSSMVYDLVKAQTATGPLNHKVDSLADTVKRLGDLFGQLLQTVAPHATLPATGTTVAQLRASAGPAPVGLAVHNG